jgi:hypothetical protein
MRGLPETDRFTVVTGHYGCGKTNLAINLALDMTERHTDVMLVDLDIVNPYFRSSDYAVMLERRGVRVISPTFAGTTLDTPSLSAAVYSAFDTAGAVIFDVGGDDVGATALGRFSKEIEAIDRSMLYVINRYRNLTGTPAEAAALLAEIERASHLKATGVVNNSHLRNETTVATVLDSLGFARDTAALLGLPLLFTTVPETLAGEFSTEPGAATFVENAYPVTIHVRTPWEDDPEAHKEVV